MARYPRLCIKSNAVCFERCHINVYPQLVPKGLFNTLSLP